MKTAEAIDLAIQIEQKVSRLYERFSTLFRGNQAACRFWSTLAYQEKEHAENLMRSKGAFLGPQNPAEKAESSASWDAGSLESIFKKVREQEKQVKKEPPSLQQAVAMMLEIENGEIHHIYNALIDLGRRKRGETASTSSHSALEHATLIKEFLTHIPIGGHLAAQGTELLKQVAVPAPKIPPARMEKRVRPQPAVRSKPLAAETPKGEVLKGRISEVTPAMGYGFIQGTDGRCYLFLLEEPIPGGSFEIGAEVSFSGRELPWGPQAMQVTRL